MQLRCLQSSRQRRSPVEEEKLPTSQLNEGEHVTHCALPSFASERELWQINLRLIAYDEPRGMIGIVDHAGQGRALLWVFNFDPNQSQGFRFDVACQVVFAVVNH